MFNNKECIPYYRIYDIVNTAVITLCITLFITLFKCMKYPSVFNKM